MLSPHSVPNPNLNICMDHHRHVNVASVLGEIKEVYKAKLICYFFNYKKSSAHHHDRCRGYCSQVLVANGS